MNQLSIYGAVSDLCEEHSTCQTSAERPILAEQSDPHFAPADLLLTIPTPSVETSAQAQERTSGTASTTRLIVQDLD